VLVEVPRRRVDLEVTEALYLTDAYLKRFEAEISSVTPEGVLLDRTAFYPSGGGQPADTGHLLVSGTEIAQVVDVRKTPGGIVHVLDRPAAPAEGSRIVGEIDWPRRFAHMRYHTALHILSGVVYRQVGSGITGNQIGEERARMDFSLPGFDRSLAESLIQAVNDVVRERRPVTVRFLPRAVAMQDPTLVRVAQELLPDVETVRLIDIEGFDIQADGGTHVANTAEVGTVRLERIENKGARNKRLYLTAESPETARL
jgi:misacylated tRNA(Ala) deacylase